MKQQLCDCFVCVHLYLRVCVRMCAHLCVNEHVGVCTIVKYSFPVYCVMYKNVFFSFYFQYLENVTYFSASLINLLSAPMSQAAPTTALDFPIPSICGIFLSLYIINIDTMIIDVIINNFIFSEDQGKDEQVM